MATYSFDAWRSEDPSEVELEELDYQLDAEFPDPDAEHDRLWENYKADQYFDREED